MGARSPGDFDLLLLAALAALTVGQPMRAHAFLKRHQKRFVPSRPVSLLTALALARQRQFTRAWEILRAEGLEETVGYFGRRISVADVIDEYQGKREKGPA